MSRVKLIIVAGVSGAGKTSLARELARIFHHTYLAHETITRRSTGYILKGEGYSVHNRETESYINHIKPLEYATTFDVAIENLQLGNSVIVDIPFLEEVQDPYWLVNFLNHYNLAMDKVDVRIIYVKCNRRQEYIRMKNRGNSKDTWKLENWDAYCESIFGSYPKHKADYLYIFDNRAEGSIWQIQGVVEWLKENDF